MSIVISDVAASCRKARESQSALASASTATKDSVLRQVATLLGLHADRILEANALDLDEAQSRGLSAAMVDRLRLTRERIDGLAKGVLEVADLPDPVGSLVEQNQRPNGLLVGRMRIPLGVVAMIFESRPNIVVDAGVLCLKSGNACILKGGSEARHSNAALVAVLHAALESCGLPSEVVVSLTDRGQVAELLEQAETVDLVIPRGGEGLIRYVTENSRIPVVQHYKGVCHVYIDQGANPDMAEAIIVNSKSQRPGVCNAAETLLIHSAEAPRLLPRLIGALSAKGVELVGSADVCALHPEVSPATSADWDTEYLDLKLSIAIVPDINGAINHIRKHGSDHTEAIVTESYTRANQFVSSVSSSCVLVNAATRFNDGSQLGLGAEIGISTSRLHAYGPMGLNELTTTKFVVYGTGQIRQ
jgi:glutamate-5-semialdehyde dehydrogenase